MGIGEAFVPTKRPTIRSTRTSVGREAEHLNLLHPTTLLLDYVILQQLFNISAERASIFHHSGRRRGSAMQLRGGQFRSSYLPPCWIGFGWRFRNRIRGF